VTDAPILLILLALCWAAWFRSWLGVLGLLVLETLSPHGFATGFMKDAPVYLVLFGVVLLGTAYRFVRERLGTNWLGGWGGWAREWRVWAFLLLWLDFLLTSWYAKDPWAAWPQFFIVSKSLVPVFLTVMLIDTRDKLYALMLTLAVSVAAATLKGGYWAVMIGFGDRVYGPPGSPYAGNNEFSVVVLMTLPLLLMFRAQSAHQSVKLALAILIGLSFIAVLSSWSRGALLGLGVVTALLVWHSQRKWLAIPLLAAGIALSFVALPESWFGRMESIVQFQGEGSAEGRLMAWRAGWEYVQREPLLGSGFEGWRFVNTDPETLRGLDWHSSYVQVLTENGLPGFLLWSALLFGGIAKLTLLSAKARLRGDRETELSAAMLRAGLAGYAVGGAFLGIAYWGLLYQMLAMAMLLERFGFESAKAVPSRMANTSCGAVDCSAGARRISGQS
jgi:probable O-glycosylation ligase (exosortase A-associated)